jgi:hypothetical protein
VPISLPIRTSPSGVPARLAHFISDILCPAVLAVPALLIGVWFSGVAETYGYALLYFAVAIPLPVGYLMWLLKTGRIADFHLPNRRDRRGPFVVTSMASLGGVGLLAYLDAPAPFVALLIAAVAQMLVLFLITLTWQISIHAATVAGLATFAALAVGGGALALSLLVPVVMWARVYLRRHTVAQVMAGGALGCATFGTLFTVHGILW